MSGAPRLQRLCPDECVRLLAGRSLGRVSLTMSALPVVRSVRYALMPGQVVFRAARDSKLYAAAADTVIAFQADYDDNEVGWSVLVQGICEPVTDAHALSELHRLRLPAWSQSQDAFLGLRLERVSGELVYWNERGLAAQMVEPNPATTGGSRS